MRFRKEKDMTTMNRLYSLYSERSMEARLEEKEMGFGFVYSSIDKQKREHCVLNTGLQ